MHNLKTCTVLSEQFPKSPNYNNLIHKTVQTPLSPTGWSRIVTETQIQHFLNGPGPYSCPKLSISQIYAVRWKKLLEPTARRVCSDL
mmetsp:Transcript_1835/g.3094  ORF Transcript_1835/g.3094 Transcript_1835/m.3094 type:complete len:87 (+) Transcript_1835:5377-5637(+)